MKKILPLYLVLLGANLSAQEHGDCLTALEICNKNTIHLDPQQPTEQIDLTELNGLPCFEGVPFGASQTESMSAWIKFTVAQPGSLFFTISPDNASDDLDFVVFQLTNGACEQKTLVRCMAAGDSQIPSPCMGPTGLMPGETDTVQGAGCSFPPGANNFLAPLQAAIGETFVVAINNFSSPSGFKVSFCGTALLGCETEVCTELSATEPEKNSLQLSPNPLSEGSPLIIEMERETAGETAFTLFNLSGSIVLHTTQQMMIGKNTLSLATHNLPKGAYGLAVQPPGQTGIFYRRLLIF